MLALGTGLSSYTAEKKRSNTEGSGVPSSTNQSSGFGIVTLASLWPVFFVEILGLISFLISIYFVCSKTALSLLLLESADYC